VKIIPIDRESVATEAENIVADGRWVCNQFVYHVLMRCGCEIAELNDARTFLTYDQAMGPEIQMIDLPINPNILRLFLSQRIARGDIVIFYRESDLWYNGPSSGSSYQFSIVGEYTFLHVMIALGSCRLIGTNGNCVFKRVGNMRDIVDLHIHDVDARIKGKMCVISPRNLALKYNRRCV